MAWCWDLFYGYWWVGKIYGWSFLFPFSLLVCRSLANDGEIEILNDFLYYAGLFLESSPATKNEPLKPSKDPSTKHKNNHKPQTSHSTSSKPAKVRKIEPARKSRAFNQLMYDVVFVMSGYQNPQRGRLRDHLVAMGAKYRSDWGPGCTHLMWVMNAR